MANNILDLISSTEAAKIDKTYSEVFKKNPLEEAIELPGPDVGKYDILRDKMFKKAAELWNTTPFELEEVMKKIAYHETMGTLDPKTKQIGGEAGGLYQYEPDLKGYSGSAKTALERTLNFITNTTTVSGVRKDKSQPRGLDYKIDEANALMSGLSDDFTKIPRSMQDVILLADYLEHPDAKANLGRALKTGGGLKELYTTIHSPGGRLTKEQKGADFQRSMDAYEKKYGRSKIPGYYGGSQRSIDEFF